MKQIFEKSVVERQDVNFGFKTKKSNDEFYPGGCKSKGTSTSDVLLLSRNSSRFSIQFLIS